MGRHGGERGKTLSKERGRGGVEEDGERKDKD